MRKTVMIPLVVLFAFAMSAQTPRPATDVSNADIQAFLKTLPRDKVSDLPTCVVDVGGYQVGIFAVFRPKSIPGDAILHQTKRTEIYQILDGSGTLVTGGTLVDAHKDGANVRGSRIQGGVSRKFFKGDVIIIPAYLPLWWSSLDSDLSYLITRPDPEREMKLK